MTENNDKKVWKFSYQMWNSKQLEGTFVATQEEIDWISDKRINFGDLTNKGLDIVVQMDSEYFQIINDDPEFAKQFQQTIKAVGDSPFTYLDNEQHEEWDSEFGETYVNGVLVKGRKLKQQQAPYDDQGSRVITYDITADVFAYQYEDEPNNPEGMRKFLHDFDIIESPLDEHVISQQPEFSRGSIDCMRVIQRKSDGQCYGYSYEYSAKYGESDAPNGSEHGIKNPNAYVWLPVKPFTITGYKFVNGEDED